MVTGQTPGLDLLACLECGKHFVSVAKLKSHEKTHSKSRPFKCIDCNKSFTVRYSLICHTRTHTRERPYQCSQCGSRFTQASSLKTHQIYKHTKNFPYACKQCDRGFISPGQRHEHVVRTHLKLSSSSGSRSTKLTLVNATILQPDDANNNGQHHHQVHSSTSGTTTIDTDQLPPGSTITLAIQTIAAPDSDDSLGPSMSSAACQTALSLPPLL
ncbi:zinc finger protein-like protein [Dermatophagoides farinae]|uniref:Zinc finger protein-like protein n=1 Tax=Dermatophagoides farinae TaxID=6954 RepID=A0A9D4P4N8_DERFA|nr:zinc finger protein-like protein [Dermatophagoides farinae]